MDNNLEQGEGQRAKVEGTGAKAPVPTERADDFWLRTTYLVLPILALFVSLLVWYQTTGQLDMIRQSQRQLLSEVASMRKLAIIDLTGAPTMGAEQAVVTLVEYSDYECPFCIRHFQQTWPQIEANYVKTGKIRYAFRDFPVDQLHPEAIKAHEAAQCAGEQGKFWDLHARLFSAPGTHTAQAIEDRALEAGLDIAAFRTCVASGRTTAAVRANASHAVEMGATGTPAFFVGVRDPATNQVKVLQAVTGAQPYSSFQRALDAALKQVSQ
jgi:protein-disulfide isomerase